MHDSKTKINVDLWYLDIHILLFHTRLDSLHSYLLYWTPTYYMGLLFSILDFYLLYLTLFSKWDLGMFSMEGALNWQIVQFGPL